jgi:hypothetical protein
MEEWIGEIRFSQAVEYKLLMKHDLTPAQVRAAVACGALSGRAGTPIPSMDAGLSSEARTPMGLWSSISALSTGGTGYGNV